jgi:intraflagellar transport protein 122
MRSNILYTLAKQSAQLGMYKLARLCYDRLARMKVPTKLQALVDLGTIQVCHRESQSLLNVHMQMRAKPFHDNEDLLLMCYSCSRTNVTTSAKASNQNNQCMHCGAAFIYSFVSFGERDLMHGD